MANQLITIDLSPAALESETAKLLRDIFRDRGLTVRHNGSASHAAPGGRPDIELFNEDVRIIVEATKLTRVAQSNNEATPVPAHLDDVAVANEGKRALGLFVSPATFDRTVDLYRNYNVRHDADGRRIAFMDFTTFNIFVDWLQSPAGASFRVADLVDLLEAIADLPDDAAVLTHINDTYVHAAAVDDEVQRVQREKLAEKYARLDSIFKRIHDDLRSVCGLGPPEAFHELSKLVFLKMYEEQAVLRESEEGRVTENRFTTKYIQEERRRRRSGVRAQHPIIKLFEEVREEFRSEALFDPSESIDIQPDKDEGNYIDQIVELVEDYTFIDPDVPLTDIKGMIYEQFLGLSLKNSDLGQYFTPEPIIEFMVEIADLETDDRVLDPACGTGRFLVQAMNEIVAKASDASTRDRIKREQLVGNEKSPYVTKIAKMNMYVHGDGRTNIHERDSLDFQPSEGDRFSVILTNPPLGEINFARLFGPYNANPAWYEGMEVIEKQVQILRRTGESRVKVTRNELKGGALFLNKFVHFVRPGARVLTVMDEAILNTDEYSFVRAFIKRHFFIVAVFSLTDDAFKHASKTATKTSILYLVRKQDADEEQTEPVFFGHAFQVGINPKGKPCPNDLLDTGRSEDLLRAFWRYRDAIAQDRAANGGRFDEASFSFPPGSLPGTSTQTYSGFSYFAVPFSAIGDRLEYKWYDPTYDPVEARVAKMETEALADIVELSRTSYGLTATGLEEADLEFINIENLRPDATVDLRGVRYVRRDNRDIRPQHFTEVDDILISRARLPGIAAMVSEAQAGMVFGSYIIRFHLKEGSPYLPEYVALYVNSIFGQAQVHRLKSGSNGYNINRGQLGQLKILRLDRDAQEELIGTIRREHEVANRLGQLMRRFQSVAELSMIRASLGAEGPKDFEGTIKVLKAQLDPVEDFLAGLDADNEDLDDISEVRRRFEIRPTFYTRLPGTEP